MDFFTQAFNAIKEGAGQGEDVLKHVVGQVLGSAAINPLGIGAGGPQSAFNRLAKGELFGAPAGAPAIPAMPSSAYGPGSLNSLLQAALLNGKTIAGTQPYAVTSYFGAASATAVVKNTDIADMFATAQCTAFTSNDTFPWPFQSYRMRWTYSSSLGLSVLSGAGTAAQVSDPSWIATLHAVFSNATEIARVALNNLGLRTSLIGVSGAIATTITAFGFEIDTQPGVLWPVYYEKNGSYVMSVRSDHAIGTVTTAYQLSMQLDGWVINDPTLTDADASQIQATLDKLMRGEVRGNSLSVS